MTPPEPQFTRGAGTPDQLPYGEASRLNQGMQQARQSAAQGASSQPPGGAPSARALAPSSVAQGAKFKPIIDTPEREFFFAPTDRPMEPVTAGLGVARRPAPPPDLLEWLPFYRDMANLPGADDRVRAMYQTLVYLQARG